jgi:hypothetical protein
MSLLQDWTGTRAGGCSSLACVLVCGLLLSMEVMGVLLLDGPLAGLDWHARRWVAAAGVV